MIENKNGKMHVTLPEVVVRPEVLSFSFDKGKADLFTRGYTQLQVDSINAIVAEANKQGVTNKAQLAYILATAYHEAYDYDGKTTGTIQRLVPIKEKGSDAYLRGKKYWPHIGFGFAQITWEDNYKKFAPMIKKQFGVDILKNPELLLRVDIAAFVIVYGMVNGTFTGKKLADYIRPTKTDFPNSRRIINGTDKAEVIAGYASKFLKCIN